MLANDARVSLIGNVIQEPRLSDTKSGQVLNMKVGVSTRRPDKNNPKYGESDFYEVAVFGAMGNALAQFVHAGSQIWVTGNMMMGAPWKDRNDNWHVSPQVTASDIKVLRSGNNNSQNNRNTNNDDDVGF